jgi:polyhydroxyalkanoate synthesis repressor PhaR
MQCQLMTGGREARLLKRYDNRKLYDTAASRYVKLEEMAEMIRLGIEVRVVHHRTGQDLTSVALAHIIFAEELRTQPRGSRALTAMVRGGAVNEERPPSPRAGAGSAAPQAPVPIGRARLRQLLNEGDRAHFHATAMARDAEQTAAALQRDAASRVQEAANVVAGLSEVRRDLARIARRMDRLHERLRTSAGPGSRLK